MYVISFILYIKHRNTAFTNLTEYTYDKRLTSIKEGTLKLIL